MDLRGCGVAEDSGPGRSPICAQILKRLAEDRRELAFLSEEVSNMIFRDTGICALFVLSMTGGTWAWACACQEKATPEAREEMAAHHDKMAACLRSDRPLGECRAEMSKTAKSCDQGCSAESGGCGMNGECQSKAGKGSKSKAQREK